MDDSLIGLFGGTFNPVHFGHINLAISLKEDYHLHEVWWIPTHCSPFRLQENTVHAQHRLNMLKLALEEIEGFQVLDLEIQRPAPSYTIDTIRQLQELHPKKKFVLLCSEDVLENFSLWKESDEIKKRIDILSGSRYVGITTETVMQISATQVRKRLEKGLYCGHLVPSKVLDYISENQLYSIP